MKDFTARLVKAVEYNDLDGKTIVVPAGEVVKVSQLEQSEQSIDANGNSALESAGSLIATRNGVSFEVSDSDFAKVHAC